MNDVRRRILYIDAYDSFANNIISLVRLTLNVDIEVITHDEYKDVQSLESCLRYFDAVVVGPGPGDPRKAEDVGIIRHLWNLPDDQVLPVLGICLGFQDLCQAFGGEIKTLHMPRHGIVSQVTPIDCDIFEHFQRFKATNYHSLHVDLHYGAEASLQELSHPSSNCPHIQPLAWDLEDSQNGRVLLAARHSSKPFWGVQYHPESICTSDQGSKIVSSWWTSALSWLHKTGRDGNRSPFPRLCRQVKLRNSRLSSEALAQSHVHDLRQLDLLKLGSRIRWRRLYRHVPDVNDLCKDLGFNASKDDEVILLRSGKQKDGSLFGQGLGRFSIIGIVSPDTIHLQYDVISKIVKLHARSEALDLPKEERVQDIFSYINQFMSSVQVTGGPVLIPFWGGLIGYLSYEAGLETIHVHSASTMRSTASNPSQRPDINFAFVTRSIVVDHALDTIYIQSILEDDSIWLEEVRDRLEQPRSALSNGTVNGSYQQELASSIHQIKTPYNKSYTSKINNCLNSIRAGDSYEICLTDQTTIHLQRHESPFASGWKLFQRLSTTNPAPFSSFVRLHSPSDAVTVVSSSPERFLSWSRSGHCQFRPIKGTVKKGPGVNYKHARAILESSKERAENLMITDLIRHDLHGVAKLGSVHVPKLMQIEEYATVYQLVSVIEGDICSPPSPTGPPQPNGATLTNGNHGSESTPSRHKPASSPTKGISLLAASLPPGSMTGAPKRRSCQLISDYEESSSVPRGIYSGVLGYLDVGGGGDFAVVIRTAVRWDGDSLTAPSAAVNTLPNGHATPEPRSIPIANGMAHTNGNETANGIHHIPYNVPHHDNDHSRAEAAGEVVIDTWRIGAGGAITAQSNAADEYAEMITKLDSTLGAFGLKG